MCAVAGYRVACRLPSRWGSQHSPANGCLCLLHVPSLSVAVGRIARRGAAVPWRWLLGFLLCVSAAVATLLVRFPGCYPSPCSIVPLDPWTQQPHWATRELHHRRLWGERRIHGFQHSGLLCAAWARRPQAKGHVCLQGLRRNRRLWMRNLCTTTLINLSLKSR